jgi:hypothetical protein
MRPNIEVIFCKKQEETVLVRLELGGIHMSEVRLTEQQALELADRLVEATARSKEYDYRELRKKRSLVS